TTSDTPRDSGGVPGQIQWLAFGGHELVLPRLRDFFGDVGAEGGDAHVDLLAPTVVASGRVPAVVWSGRVALVRSARRPFGNGPVHRTVVVSCAVQNPRDWRAPCD